MTRPLTLVPVLLVLGACLPPPPEPELQRTTPEKAASARGWGSVVAEEQSPPSTAMQWTQARVALAASLADRGIDEAIVDAVNDVPRHLFLPGDLWPSAYQDVPLELSGYVVREPSVVADMIARAWIDPGDRALVIGPQAGYVAALLVELGADVDAIETVPGLALGELDALDALGYAEHVRMHPGDRAGWPARARYDAILASAPPEHARQPLADQLASGGRLVVAEGRPMTQRLVVVQRGPEGRELTTVVPIGAGGSQPARQEAVREIDPAALAAIEATPRRSEDRESRTARTK